MLRRRRLPARLLRSATNGTVPSSHRESGEEVRDRLESVETGTPARSSSYQRPLGLRPPSLTTRVISEERVALIRGARLSVDQPSSPAAPGGNRPATRRLSVTTQSRRRSAGQLRSRRTATSPSNELAPARRPDRAAHRRAPVSSPAQ